MRAFTISILLGLALAALFHAEKLQAEEKSNVIIFLADDEGYGELGIQGNEQIPTPHIDSIAKNGIHFTNGYVSGTYCSPTRAGLMTGRYQTRFGHEFNPGRRENAGLPTSEKTIADYMKDLGYATAAVGKWHLGEAPKFRPTKRGFDEFYGTLANTSFFKPKRFVDTRESKEVHKVLEDSDFYTTDAYAERVVDWIERNQDRPYFLYLPFNAQHAPLQAPQKYLDRFPNIEDEKRKKFAAMMSAKDDAVGRVLEKVRELGQEEKTLIFYLADNGGPTKSTTSKNDPLRGFKATTLEGGIRVPFMVQWKGTLPAGKVYEKPVIQLDILPTVVAAAGGEIDLDAKIDGVNLLPYLAGEKDEVPHETLYWRFGPQRAIRRGDWKLVESRLTGEGWKLFNLAEDIGEMNDLSEEHPEKVKELAAAWEEWNEEQAEPLWDRPDRKRGKGKGKRGGDRRDRQREVREEVQIDGKPSFYKVTQLELDAPSDIVKPLRLQYIPGSDLADAFIYFDFPQYETQPPVAVTLTLLDDTGATLSKQRKTVVDHRAELRKKNMSGEPSPSIPAYYPIELTARFQFPAETFPKIRTAVIAFERN